MKILLVLLLTSLWAGSGSRVPTFSEDIDAAFAMAKKTGKPLLIDFYGIWCPPCQEMDETVFEGKTFLEDSKNFVLLKVDADKEYSWPLKDKYSVGGYPTYLFLSSTGEEIYRVVGYRGPKVFSRIMDLVLKSKGKTLADSCKSPDFEDQYRCAVICGERGDEKCARAAYGKLVKAAKKIPRTRYLLARSFLADHLKKEVQKKSAYLQLMESEGDHPLAIIWAWSYLGETGDKKLSARAKAALGKVARNVDKMIKSAALAETGLTRVDVIGIGGNIERKLGNPARAKARWQQAAALLEKLAEELPKGSSARGFTLDRIYYLNASGKTAEALALAETYRKRFPEEFTFHYRAANLLKEQNQIDAAISAGKKAFQHSYGDNRIRSATLLMDLYAQVPDKEAAKAIYDDVKGKIKPSSSLNVRTHRYLLKLDQAYIQVVIASQQKG